MNVDGGTRPNSGWHHRRRASTPTIFPRGELQLRLIFQEELILCPSLAHAILKLQPLIARPFISRVKNCHVFLAFSFALNSATSAFFRRLSQSSPSSGKTPMPML
jgi:DNA-binding transcriptional LysR family regulator